MKFTLTFKDPDVGINNLADVLYDKSGQDYYDFIRQWTDGEYVTIQFDSDARTATLLRNGEIGIDEHHEKSTDVVAKVDRARFFDDSAELHRQLDEAAETLAKEEDKTTPYARSLLKFIIETRDTLKLMESWEEFEDDGGLDYGIDEDEIEFDDEDEIEEE